MSYISNILDWTLELTFNSYIEVKKDIYDKITSFYK
ncbi:hypothetical protein F207_073 [Campylobacter phage F207]|uniref:Uncharacterized protein n=1 Tax=Campylobacter phage F207 TaxID=2794360 RepID=A0A7T3KCT0_9CAUD|nr:hypothetical protein F207_073 [Campylobacter phage F207]